MTDPSDAQKPSDDAAAETAADSPETKAGPSAAGTESTPAENKHDPETEQAAPSKTTGEAEQEEDDLPEWEPLTPELVEDEAIRGDVMLRVAVIGLAFLLACTEIRESTTLVHIRSGQYMAGHGLLPPRQDVFSSTAGDRTWVNTAWLFDLTVAGVYSLGEAVAQSYGAVLLSLAKALVAAVAFGFVVYTTKRETSTWWGSICAAIALVVCYPQFSAEPQLVTLLGLAIVLWMLNRWRESTDKRAPWLLVPVFFVWCNFDPRMFLGLALLVLYALGQSVGSLLGRSGHSGGPAVKQLWMVTAACFGVALLNPFLWATITAPLTLYGVEYPELREYYSLGASIDELQYVPLASARFWSHLNHHAAAAMLLLVAAAITFALNFEKMDWGLLFAFIGFVGFALAGSHELAAASLVATVAASLNGQEWYRANFRQSYSVDTSELLFSRGGRAVTVLAFFGLSYLAISGRLDGADGRRTGVGFHGALEAAFTGLRQDLEDSFDDRPFNLSLRQGDELIWIGQKPFVDSRVALYAGRDDDDLLGIHRRTRMALRAPVEGVEETGKPQIWQSTFDRFHITHVVPRLSGDFPDYQTFLDLRLSSPDRPDWHMAFVGSSTAAFYRTDIEDPELAEYRKSHSVNFVEEAFKAEDAAEPDEQQDPGSSSESAEDESSEDESPATEELPQVELHPRVDWPRPLSVYQRYLSLPETIYSNAIQQARHYERQYSESFSGNRIFVTPVGMALAHLAIRKVNEGLSENPQIADGYAMLGLAYYYLGRLESSIAQRGGGSNPSLRRFYQAVQAYNQSLVIEPDNPRIHLRLFDLFRQQQRVDLALRSLDRYNELVAQRPFQTESAERLQDGLLQARDQLSARVDQIRAAIDEQLQNPEANPLAIAQLAYTNGCSLLAMEILDAHMNLVNQSPQFQLLRAIIMMEIGRTEDAALALARLKPLADQRPDLMWRPAAATAALANAQYRSANELLREELDQQRLQRVSAMMQQSPFIDSPARWPVAQTRASMQLLFQLPDMIGEYLYEIALNSLEMGETQEAANTFHQLLDEYPDTPLRPIVRFYLQYITGEVIEAQSPGNRIPITVDMFAADEDADSAVDEDADSNDEP